MCSTEGTRGVPAASTGGRHSNGRTASPIGAVGTRRGGHGDSHTPGAGTAGEREGCETGNGGNEGGRKHILKGGARSGLDRLLFVSSLPKAGSTGHRPTRRRAVPAGWSGSRSRPPFFTATGGSRRLASSPAPTPPRTSPHFLSLPPSPATTPLHTPPRVRPTAATLPAPLTDFMAEAMSSYLSACSARRALCSSCSRSPMAASVVAAGLGSARPSERAEGGRGCAAGRARVAGAGTVSGAARWAVPGRADLCRAGLCRARLGCAGLGWAVLAAAPSPAGRAPGPTAACAARSLALLPPPAPARREGNEGAEPRCCRGGEGAPLPRALFLGDVTCYK